MRPSARILANRRNACRSTGPKTELGKARIAKNALRHGLAIPVTFNLALAEEVEHLARLIAGTGADPARFERARRIAEAEIDLLRVRRARYALLTNPMARVRPPSPVKLLHAYKRAQAGLGMDEIGRAVLRALRGVNANLEPLTLEEGFEVLPV
jgi:hypothetical protein